MPAMLPVPRLESILLVDDNATNLQVLYKILQDLDIKLMVAKSGEAALKIAAKAEPSLVLLDIMMPPGIDGYETCRLLKADEATQGIPVVFLSALDDVTAKVKGFDVGAVDYISKPFESAEVIARVKTQLTIRRLHGELEQRNSALQHELSVAGDLVAQARDRLEGPLLGSSKAVEQLRASISEHGGHDRPLLIAGLPGSGHEAVARSIHDHSARSGHAFIYHSCLGMSAEAGDDLLGSGRSLRSFFGEKNPGRWGLADGGTLCLDQLQVMPEALQKRLLKRIEQASKKGGLATDVRVIMMAACEVPEDLGAGSFPGIRDDLLQGFAGDVVRVPALRDRGDDVAELAKHYVRRKAGRMGRKVDRVSKQALRRLAGYSWPGNVDELASVIECAIAASTEPILEIDDALLDSGRRMGSYQLTQKLGEGGMGEVWLAKHRLLVRPAAVKLIRASNLAEEARAEMAQRFEREARATAALESPNTVRLYDYGISTDGDLYYVMERLRGMDLDVLVARHGPLSPPRAVHFLQQACASLAEAHDAGMVHRDIKPANLFAAVMGIQCDILKVLDFGTVRHSQSQDMNLTGTSVIGTPAFMAPEQVMGKTIDGRADIYALGCVAYWLLTGKFVFDADNVVSMIAQHASVRPRPPSSVVNTAISAGLDDIVMACLAKHPDDRPISAAEVRGRLLDTGLSTQWTEDAAQRWWRDHTDLLAPRTPLAGTSPG